MPAVRRKRHHHKSVSPTTATKRVQNRKSVKQKSIDKELECQYSPSVAKGEKEREPLPEFVARVACLLWFEETSTLQAIEDGQRPVRCRIGKPIPSPWFQEWVVTILSATQVSVNVVFLALELIYRLKRSNSRIGGKRGSEFMLMTVALMLGNKCSLSTCTQIPTGVEDADVPVVLDDVPYSNGAWSEVSGIPKHQIHSIEIAFLRYINYNLFSSKVTWSKWRSKLVLFGKYCHSGYEVPTV
ncbi:uncharacterized protein N7446_010780 [Penicillium canescens]|uniref:uncharacterized protein n=1 Tax=Penicillium canescens TaxID=5083 RepID=UPI0026E05A98|nr:uncharacterized protein N7446_010780 [Penicillium canescens]KAJ6050671.1 hypothetical protein N7446_010780 [Penicillium canescens]KAJ6065892.1 hypothetical protein N7444_001545 [Penicillium canescens]